MSFMLKLARFTMMFPQVLESSEGHFLKDRKRMKLKT